MEKWLFSSLSTCLAYNLNSGGRNEGETIVTHCADMDVHQKSIFVCVMMGPVEESPIVETQSFPTTTKHLYEMLRSLESKRVTQIAMESTGIYWKPVYNIIRGVL